MFFQFFKFFWHYLFFARTRQRLLLMAIVGLALSSFSLLVLQSVMGGLQRGVVSRSQSIHGSLVMMGPLEALDQKTMESVQELSRRLKNKKIQLSLEYEIELLARHDRYMAPLKIHGLSPKFLPPFLSKKDLSGLVLGADLGHRLQVDPMQAVSLISPAHANSLLGDIPRVATESVTDLFLSELMEVDGFEGWVRSSALFNLTRQRQYNLLRFFYPPDLSETQEKKLTGFIKQQCAELGLGFMRPQTWADKNQSLVYALALENQVMTLLFVGMSFLVGLTITSGLMSFLQKLKSDLTSFWILGLSQKKLERLSFWIIQSMGLGATILGLILGAMALYFLEHWGGEIMPDIFVERKIPVAWNPIAMLKAFLIPFGISFLFSTSVFRLFLRDQSSYLEKIRGNQS